jgi:hypothetical protein
VTYFSKSTEKLVFGALNTTQHLPEVWGVFFGDDLDLDLVTYFSKSTKKLFFGAPNTTQHLPEVWGVFRR